MARSVFWRFFAAWIVAPAMMHVSCGSGLAREATKPSLVVSYLIYTGRVPETNADALPMENLPSTGSVPESWQWRVFDPTTRRDSLFQSLQSFPTHVHWDPAFENVEFLVGDRIERAQWRFGSRPSLQATLPSDSSVCDVWSDQGGGWHLVTQRDTPIVRENGEASTVPVAMRWDRDRAGAWHMAVVDSPGGGHYGGCYTSQALQEGAPRVRAITLDSLLTSMRLGNHRDSALQSGGEWELVWVGSDLDPSIGLEMRAGFGDTYHAKEPMVWVNRAQSRRETVYAEGQSHEDGQIAFGEHAGFLLVAAEYSGTYPAVIDMRTGKTLLKVDRLSARAVWVPAPRGWDR